MGVEVLLRGHQPILMDFGIIDGVRPADPGAGHFPYESFEPARYAMGDTRRFAERMALVRMQPRGDLSSTGYALADPGREYLVLDPGETAEPVTVTVDAGSYALEWYAVDARATTGAGTVTADRTDTISAGSPVDGPAVLYLRSI